MAQITIGSKYIKKFPSQWDSSICSYMAIPSMSRDIKRFITINLIIDKVSIATGFSLEEMRIKKRKRPLVISRQLVCYFSKKYCKLTLKSIGSALSIDHATVLHGHKTISNLMDVDKSFKLEVLNIEAEIKKEI